MVGDLCFAVARHLHAFRRGESEIGSRSGQIFGLHRAGACRECGEAEEEEPAEAGEGAAGVGSVEHGDSFFKGSFAGNGHGESEKQGRGVEVRVKVRVGDLEEEACVGFAVLGAGAAGEVGVGGQFAVDAAGAPCPPGQGVEPVAGGGEAEETLEPVVAAAGVGHLVPEDQA